MTELHPPPTQPQGPASALQTSSVVCCPNVQCQAANCCQTETASCCDAAFCPELFLVEGHLLNLKEEDEPCDTVKPVGIALDGDLLNYITEKPCTRCKTVKPVQSFFRDPTKKYGYTSWCKACFQDYSQQKKATVKPLVKERVCTICKCMKPADQFIRDSRKNSGLDARCKICRREQHKAQKQIRDAAGVQTATEKICRRCQQLKPASAFKKHSYTTSGLDSWCKACCNARRKEKFHTDGVKTVVASKRCKRCQQVKPSSEFTRDKGKVTGIGPRCRTCENQYRKEKRLVKASAVIAAVKHEEAPTTVDTPVSTSALIHSAAAAATFTSSGLSWESKDFTQLHAASVMPANPPASSADAPHPLPAPLPVQTQAYPHLDSQKSQCGPHTASVQPASLLGSATASRRATQAKQPSPNKQPLPLQPYASLWLSNTCAFSSDRDVVDPSTVPPQLYPAGSSHLLSHSLTTSIQGSSQHSIKAAASSDPALSSQPSSTSTLPSPGLASMDASLRLPLVPPQVLLHDQHYRQATSSPSNTLDLCPPVQPQYTPANWPLSGTLGQVMPGTDPTTYQSQGEGFNMQAQQQTRSLQHTVYAGQLELGQAQSMPSHPIDAQFFDRQVIVSHRSYQGPPHFQHAMQPPRQVLLPQQSAAQAAEQFMQGSRQPVCPQPLSCHTAFDTAIQASHSNSTQQPATQAEKATAITAETRQISPTISQQVVSNSCQRPTFCMASPPSLLPHPQSPILDQLETDGLDFTDVDGFDYESDSLNIDEDLEAYMLGNYTMDYDF